MGHAGAASATDLDELYPWRILAGVGCGCLMATVNAAIAQARAPDLLYGLAWAAAYVFSSVMAIAITGSNALVTYDIVYGSLTLAAGIDDKGRWAAIAGGILVLSSALGPVFGALLMKVAGYNALAWIQWPAALLAVAIFARVHRGRA